MKKLICFLLCLVMLLPTVIACKKKTDAPADTSATGDSADSTVQTDEYGQVIETSSIPDSLDYGGEEIVIACRSANQYRREFGVEKTEDALDSRIFRRNQKIQQDLNIKLTLRADFDHKSNESAEQDIYQYVYTEHQAGQESVDILGFYAAYAAQFGLRDLLLDLNSDKMTYLDLTKKYWNQTYVDAASVNGHLYYAVGDSNLSVYDRCVVNFVNLDVLQSRTGVSADQLFGFVRDGEWTIDKMKEMLANAAWIDSGDNQASDTDTFGYVWNQWVQVDPYTVAFNFKMIKENEDGSLSFTIGDNLDRMDTAFNKLLALYKDPSSYGTAAVTAGNIFRDGRAVMWSSLLYQDATTHKKLLDSAMSYAIIPLPKLEVDPTIGYQTTPIDTYTTMAVINNKNDKTLEAISATLERMNEWSYSDVRPFYVEKMVKARYVDDGDSVQMLEMIFDGITFTKEWIYLTQTSIIASLMWRHVFQANFNADPDNCHTSVSAQWQAKQSLAEAELEDLYLFFKD